jgi:hypothetical protein
MTDVPMAGGSISIEKQATTKYGDFGFARIMTFDRSSE